MSFDITASIRSFYADFYIICSRVKFFKEPVKLAMHESYCLPLLAYDAGVVSCVSWSKASDRELNYYKTNLTSRLRQIVLPVNALLCSDVKCK